MSILHYIIYVYNTFNTHWYYCLNEQFQNAFIIDGY